MDSLFCDVIKPSSLLLFVFVGHIQTLRKRDSHICRYNDLGI